MFLMTAKCKQENPPDSWTCCAEGHSFCVDPSILSFLGTFTSSEGDTHTHTHSLPVMF